MYKLPKVPPPPSVEGPPGARKRLAELLVVLRSIDPPGAFAAISEDGELVGSLVQWPGSDAEAAWERLVSKVFELAQAQRCLRCGTCCRNSSPTLYRDDLDSVKEGRIKRHSLFSLRAGELVRSARLGRPLALDEDLVKLKERPQGGCLLLDDHLCRTYDDRPLQCRNLECWSGRDGAQLEDRPRLSRRDLFADDETAIALIEEYEVKLPVVGFLDALEAAKIGDAEAARVALAYIERDHRLRAAIAERYGYAAAEQELLFGRDAIEIVRSLGVVIRLDESGETAFVSR